MFSGQGSVVVGYRWITFGGENACKQCAALKGREYYLNPGPGQASTLDMPHPPLHPNCGCKLMEIIDVARAGGRQGELEGERDLEAADGQPGEEDGEEDDPGIRPYMRGLVVRDSFFGGLWRKNAILKGPIYRKYGGLEWTAGKDVSDGNDNTNNYSPAEDDMDEIFVSVVLGTPPGGRGRRGRFWRRSARLGVIQLVLLKAPLRGSRALRSPSPAA